MELPFNCIADNNLSRKSLSLYNHFDGKTVFDNFSYDFVDQELFIENLSNLFNIARQKWAFMERKYFLAAYRSQDEDWWQIRKELIQFFWNIKTFFDNLECENKQAVLSVLIENLKKFCQVLGSLSKLNWDGFLNIYPAASFQEKLPFHFLHLNLDIRWIIVTILKNLEESLSYNEAGRCLLDDIMKDLLWDLVGIAINKFLHISLSLTDYQNTRPFSCKCMQKFWVLFICFMDSRHETKNTGCFWMMLRAIFNQICDNQLDNTGKLPSNVKEINGLGFCWWLLFHLAQLYPFDSLDLEIFSINKNDLRQIKKPAADELKNLLKRTFHLESFSYSEGHLRCYLGCCLKILKLWKPSVDFCSILWDYFRKRLNENFLLSNELTVVIPQGKSGRKWKSLVEGFLNDPNDSLSNLSSFQLFLKILYYYLKEIESNRSGWEELRDTITLQSQLVQTFNTTGLYNCCNLIMTTTMVGNLQESVSLFVNTVATVNVPFGTDGGKNALVWKSCFAMMFICVENSCDITPLAKTMIGKIQDIQRESSKPTEKKQLSNCSIELLTIYFESLKDLFEHSPSLKLSQHILLSFDVASVLSCVHDNMSIVHIFIQSIQIFISKIKHLEQFNGINDVVVQKNLKMSDIVVVLYKYIFPWFKKLVASGSIKTTNFPMSDIAIAFTTFCFHYPLCSSESLKEQANYFCFNNQISDEFRCQYIVELMRNSSLITELKKNFLDFEPQIMRTWFNMLFQLPHLSSHLTELSNLLMHLPEMHQLFVDAKTSVLVGDSSDEIFNQLLKVFAGQYTLGKNIQQLRSKVALYMSDLPKLISIVLKRDEVDEILRMYTIVGKIFQHISPLLYTKADPRCLFHQFVQLVLTPTILSNPERTQSAFLALKANINLFIEGISCFNFTTDAYIGRTLKDIFKLYYNRLILNSDKFEMATDPLLLSCLRIKDRNNGNFEFIRFVVEAIREQYILCKESHSSVSLGLHFVKELIIHCSDRERSDLCSILLNSILKLLNQTENDRPLLLNLVEVLVGSNERLKNCLLESLESIIDESFNQFLTIPPATFKLLEIISTVYPEIVKTLNQKLGDIISLRERDKCGTDEALRQRYRQYLTKMDTSFISYPR